MRRPYLFTNQSTMTIEFPPTQTELLETFEELEDWEDRYEYLLDIGRELPKLDPARQTQDHKVHGCMSQVWLIMENNEDPETGDGSINILADSDSMIVRGLIVILLSLYQNKPPVDAIAVDPQAFFATLGLNQHLSPNRRNGLYSMVGRIRELCVKFEAGAC